MALADKLTAMLGTLKATGIRGGGTAEVSGKDELRYVDLSTINTGVGGQLLLDPSFITIGDFEQESSWQYAAIIGAGVAPGVPGVGDLETNDRFGGSVSLNAAADRLAVGAPSDDGFGNVASDSGSVRLFTFINPSFGGGALGRGYSGTGNLDLGTALEADDQFGSSVSLNAAGDRLAVGARLDNGFGNVASNSGSVRLFTFAGTDFGGAALAGTIGHGYLGSIDFDITGGLLYQIGSAIAYNANASSLALGDNNAVILLRRGTGTAIGNLAFADNDSGTSNISVTALQAALSTGQAISFEASTTLRCRVI